MNNQPSSATGIDVSAPSLATHRPEFLWSPTRNELVTTKFMRNRILFSTLAQDILPRLRKEKKRPLRLLFWACSTGAEPYTLKFLLGPDSKDEIIGIDQDADAIRQANLSVFHPDTWTTFFDGQKKLLTEAEVGRLFEPAAATCPDSFRVAQAFRRNVSFLTGDLFSARPAVSENSFDLVVCNNLLLHLKPHSAGLAWDYLLRYLNADGLLLVGGCDPSVRATAAKRLNLLPCPERLAEISKNWSGVSGAWNFKERPAWAYSEPDENDSDYQFLAGEIFKRNSAVSGESLNDVPLPAQSPAVRPKNIIISGSSFWNPGDDFVREGVMRVLHGTLPGVPLNFLFYNFNPDVLPYVGQLPYSNIITQGDLEKFHTHVDAIVIVGVSAGHELKPLYHWVLTNHLAHKVFLISGHYESAYLAEHIVQEPEASIFRQACVLIGRTNKFPDFIRDHGLKYHRVNCPALLSVPEVKAVPAGKKIERIGFSIQLPPSLGGVHNQSCGEEPYRLAMEVMYSLAKDYQVEVVAHHKTEYFHFLERLQGTGIPVVFSSFYQDLFATYRRYDLVVTTRLHASLFANGHGIPGIIINDTDRHTHALEGFPHSPCVNTLAKFEDTLAHWQQADLGAIAREAHAFKTDLISRYVQILRPAMTDQNQIPVVTAETISASQIKSPLTASLDDAGRILFVRTDSIGDAVLASAMIEPLHRRYPKAKLAVLCQQHVAELFSACPFVDSVICFDRKQMDIPTERAQIISEIAAFNPDVILNSVRSRDQLSNELSLAFRAARHIAIEGDRDNISAADHARSLSGYELIVPSPGAHKSELDRHADFLGGLEIETLNLQPVVWTSADDELLADEFFKMQELDPQKTIAVFPGAQHAVRVYHGYADALKNLSGFRFLIFGDASQTHLAEEMELQLPGRTVNLCGRSSLRETIALVRRCRLYVGAESAGAHIACAVGVPNVVLLGGGHFGRFMPYSPLTSAVVLPLDCFGCNWRCSHKHAHCIKDVAPEILAEAIRQSLGKNSPRARIFLQPSASWNGGEILPLWQKPDAWLKGRDVELIEVAATTGEVESVEHRSQPSTPAACPVCQTAASAIIFKKGQPYHVCPACDCVFTPHIEAAVVQTENNGNSARHDHNQDAIRWKRLTTALGRRAEHVIDFGCGKGETTKFIQAQGVNTIGIDQDTATQLKDVADNSMDGILMVEVIEHLFQPHEIFSQFNRVLKTDGVVYVESSFADKKELATWGYLDPAIGHCTVHSLRSMDLLAEKNGFGISWLNPNVCCLAKTVTVKWAEENPAPQDDMAQADIEIVGDGIADPVVTVVVSTYQSEKFIRACLENLSRQTIFDRCEIIVVDSGSPENERAIVAEFQKKFSNIRYLRTPRETLYGAWNRGLSIARGRYWANLNTDDSLRDDALEILAASLDKHTGCALAYSDTAWTTKPNDTFPSAHITRTVKYPDYRPVDTLFYGVTGCVEFWRTDAIRKLGGFDGSMRCAEDYGAIIRMMEAGLPAVHIPEVLSLFYQNTTGLTMAADTNATEAIMLMNRARNALDIGKIFRLDPNQPDAAAQAWTALAIYASRFTVPWEDKPLENVDYAFECFHRALSLDPQNDTAGMNLIALHFRLNRLNLTEAELVGRWPKSRNWIDRLRAGESCPSPLVQHACPGPVYRPADWTDRPTAAQLAREPGALQPWITRIDGRHVYLSEDFFPRPAGLRYTTAELQMAGKSLTALMMSLRPFFAHLGGAGDALLLLASFYDRQPDGIIFSHPNNVGATRALFDAFPKLSKIYFLPQHSEPFFHISLRYLVCTLRNCLGAGATPKDNYDEEWKAGLDLEKKYRINKSPRWAAAFRQNTGSRKVAVAPKGSQTGMVGSKRNIILPELWPQILAHILERGFEPVIFGVPSEAKDYPALPGCTDARGESFPGQMKSIGQCAGLVGADSWAKSFSAIAEIPTLVFEPLKSADLVTWKDPSDWVFIEPWPSITMIRSLEEFRRAFDARIAKIPGAEPQKNSKPVIAWEGSFLDYGSLSHINRELTSRLTTTFDLTCVGPNVLNGRAQADPAMQRCAKKLAAKASAETTVTVRHQWPPNWAKPASGALVVIQPWEYGALPKAWVANEKNVDEFWVPSPIVRAMYVNSGIAPEKVRVVPNGVDTKKFRPGVRPLPLKTKKKFKFLFVGGTIFRKGPDILLAAFSQAFTADDDVCLVVKDFGGDSCYQGQTAGEAIRALQQKPGAPEILHLTEELSAEQMPSLYAACDCLVLPYRGEGFGMPVLEAMACGLPVVVTAGGATDSFVPANAGWMIPSRGIRLSDHVGDIPLVKNGWMLEPSTPHLVTIFKIAASRPDECRQRGANGRASTEKRFDWNDIAASVVHRLKELAERVPEQIKSGRADLPVSQIVKPFAKGDRQVSPTKLVLPAIARVGRLEEARELFTQKNFQAAWTATLTAITQRPFHPEAFLLLAEIARAAGDGSAAKLCAQRARVFAPGWNPAKQFLKNPLKGNTRLDWLQPSSILHPPSSTRLSVCLIVKNEEKFLAQCLNSVRGLASQIIVVDTGSTDRTVEIAKEFGAEIYSFAWGDDFATARNAALEHATGDWVLMLDADEELPAAQHAQLRADMNKSEVMAFRLPLVNHGQEAEGRSFVPRLFRNAPGNYYFGRIHEQVFSSLLPQCKAWELKTALGTAEILHHGYTKEMVRDRNKIERNLKLLPQAIAENPTDVNLVMNLGLELVRSDNLSAGIEKYRDAFDLMSAQPTGEVVAELREVLLTQFTSQLYKIRAHEEIVRVLDSPLARHGSSRRSEAETEGLTASLDFALGLSHFELKDYRAAANQMRQCLAKRKQPALSPINTDILTAAPNHCLALSLAKLGDLAGAETAFQAALGEPIRLDDVKLDHAKFLLNQNRAVDALNELHEMVTASPANLAAWRLGGDIALSQPEFLEFAGDWTGEAMKNQADDLTITAQRAETLMLSGDTAAAVELWERVWNRERQPKFLAALILCEAVESPTTHAPEDGPDELAASRAFIAWYQKLIASRAQTVIGKINDASEKLSRALPTAAKLLEAALAESETCDTV